MIPNCKFPKLFILSFITSSIFVAALFLISCQPDRSSQQSASKPEPDQSVSLFKPEGTLFIMNDKGDTTASLSIEFADNEFEQERGLMYRHHMPDSAGMFFIFPEENYRSFWMKNTHISLDILYIDSRLIIQTIKRNTVPFSEASVPSDVPAQYVLEVNAGYCEIHGIIEGMQVGFRSYEE